MKRNVQVIWVIVGAIVLGLSYLYLQIVKPVLVTARAIGQTASYDSAKVSYSSNGEQVKAEVDLAGKDKTSDFNFTIREITSGKGDELLIQGIVNKENMYLQGNYAKPKTVEEILKKIYPKITSTKTYKEASPIWLGEKWLHIAIPEGVNEETNEQSETENMLSTSEGKRIAWKWLLAIKPRGITNNYQYGGESYKKIAYGIRKNNLIAAIEDFKNYDVDIKVSQINSLIKAVESSDDWDRDLVTFLIDKNGDLRIVTMELPQMDEEALNASIKENTASKGGEMGSNIAVAFKKMLMGEEKETIKLGSIKFGSFDEVREATAPEAKIVVEGEALMLLAQKELGPVLAEILTGKTSVGTKTGTTTPTQVTRTPAPAQCYQYQIREGEFASNKCYSKSDYNDLAFYIQRYNSAIFEYNGAAGQASVTCNGFSENFKQQCEKNKAEMAKAEADKQLYAGNIRTVIARGK